MWIDSISVTHFQGCISISRPALASCQINYLVFLLLCLLLASYQQETERSTPVKPVLADVDFFNRTTP